MTLGGERTTVQSPLLRYAEEAGWTSISPEEAFELRRGDDGLLLHETFLNLVQRLNPGIVDHVRAEELAKAISRVLPRIEGNLHAWEYLRGLKTVFVPDEKQERNVTLISEDWEENTYHVTDELTYYNGSNRIRLDVAFFINGLPLLFVETKAATKMDGIAEALEQVRRYHRQGAELMALMQIFTLTHLVHYYYGPTWETSHKSLFNWREESAGQDFETLVKTFIHPQRVVPLIHESIFFTRQDDELKKVILRPHQMRAVERVVRRAADAGKRRGLIWHTQGSGKTYTMITAAKQIIENPLFKNPTVLMLVDRNELEAQLFGNLSSVGFGHVEVARSKRHLRELLARGRRGLIVSMIHKFDDIPANINTNGNVFVLVDEAHRTTGGDLGNYLMGALPNATYIGFTGTPIDKTAYGKGTFKVFGVDDQPQGYLDKYSIAQSIEDGTTVPLRYALAPNELRVDRETLDREFLEVVEAEGLSDLEELDHILSKAVNLGNMLKNDDRMARVARYVVEHFSGTVEPMGYKAFLVAVDRVACAKYKDLLDGHLPAEYSQVVYSAGHNDPDFMARFHLSEEREQQIRRAFRKTDELPKILIVTEKLLTGFDAPVLYCMYLDKPMRDHVLLQAIARVNRPYEDEDGRRKTSGFVLDFVGIFEKLEKALAFDSKDVEGVVTDVELLKERFMALMERAKAEFLPLAEGPTPDRASESVIRAFRDEEKRQTFYQFYRELADLYEILSPDPFLRPHLHDYDLVSRMYRLLRSAYEGVFVDRELTRKTARLVQEHTRGGEIQDTLEVYEINEGLLERLAEEDTSDTVKVFNLLKSIQELVARSASQAPYLISIGERAESIAQAFQQRQQDTQDALRALEDLIREINHAEQERTEKALEPEAFAVYWLLSKRDFPAPEMAAAAMEEVFREYSHWRFSAQQQREVRRKLYGVLLRVGAESKRGTRVSKDARELAVIVDQILRVAVRAGEQG